MMVRETTWRTIAIAAIAVAGFSVADRVLRGYLFSATEPRTITERADLLPGEQTTSKIFAAVAPSVVAVYARREGDLLSGGEGATGSGSGFIWDKAGHVVTNHHVIANASEVGVVLDSGRAVRASVVGDAPWVDLAVLRLEAVPDDLQPIPVGRSSDLLVGQSVLAVGNPFGLSRTLTTGIISALNRRLPTSAGREVAGVIQTDAAINPGNSGGPLVDSAGRLIGVNTAILAPSGAFAGVGFAVPVDTVNRIVPNLIKDGRAPLAGIGIVAVAEEIAARLPTQGVVIDNVRPGSSAQKAGLVGVDRRGRVGDIIVAVGGKPVTRLAELAEELDKIGIGKDATLTIDRAGRKIDVTVTVQDIGR